MTIKEATSLEKHLSSAIKKLASKWQSLGRKQLAAAAQAFDATGDGSADRESARHELPRISSTRDKLATACTLLTSEHIRLSRAIANNIGDHVAFRLAYAASFRLDRLWVLLK